MVTLTLTALLLSVADATPLAVLALELVSRKYHRRRYPPKASLGGQQQQQQHQEQHQEQELTASQRREHFVNESHSSRGVATWPTPMVVVADTAPPSGLPAAPSPIGLPAAQSSPIGLPAAVSPVALQIAAASLPVAPVPSPRDHYLFPQPGTARYKETQEAQSSILVKSGSGVVSSRI